ncbi:pyridoxamine 5'-phosphate oxidase family protein [Halieaceae bacterium IMCC14734]|uniref:Pyridoxamine 5'-phosphate oxidase family protein n=1 Tax=Candidatus Litorirhabdus singularis TaxID=2518993 RepID=A0ABT3TCX2_9GAMM|nr:pyridoxamine 5'-phosphate oxidase family protein [Candidatus Litorirhabdus singularis]MCX2979636.1 pyridoxamine 5'-phosphate oxidase family protein [Candidatus Litorirhabdus singularis]
MTTTYRGAWKEAEVAEFLQQSSFPIRLASVGADGFPRVVSLWFRHQQDQILCVSHRDSHLIKILSANPRVGFEVAPNEPPYYGVRGQALVSLEPLGDKSTLHELLSRYLGGSDSGLGQWLLDRSDEELLITLKPSRIYSWDYRERMAEAV